MRLVKSDAQKIQSIIKEHFGKDATIWLFGSRVDDQKRGGDIDLLVRPANNIKNDLFLRKIKALSSIKKAIGDRKIDLVVEQPDDTRTIVHNAHSEGIQL